MPGTVSALGAAGVLVVVLVAFGLAGGAAVQAVRVSGAADAAALAAADAISGAVPGDPCDAAAHVARGAGALLAACELDGPVATVAVASAYGGIPFDARSRAGPPPSRAR